MSDNTHDGFWQVREFLKTVTDWTHPSNVTGRYDALVTLTRLEAEHAEREAECAAMRQGIKYALEHLDNATRSNEIRHVSHAYDMLKLTESSTAAGRDLLAERDRLRELLTRRTDGLFCFSCGTAWTEANDAETCEQAHRETWTHEWVSLRVHQLTKSLFEANEERDRLAARVTELEAAQSEREFDVAEKQGHELVARMELRDEIDRLAARCKAMEGTLKPFASYVVDFDTQYRGDKKVDWPMTADGCFYNSAPRLSDCRRAADVLKEGG